MWMQLVPMLNACDDDGHDDEKRSIAHKNTTRKEAKGTCT